MNQHMQRQQIYVLGHAPEELRRLILQAVILRPITARLLQDAGISRGMRVLDLGCGAGDVTMLLAEMVGPSGSVIGIDRSPQALALARERIGDTRHRNVTFTQCAVEDYAEAASFDAVVGRYVLVHQPDPLGFLHSAARLLRPDGVLAFHEIELSAMRALPNVEIWDKTVNVILDFFCRMVPNHNIGNRLIELFAAADLPCPKLFCEVPIGGGPASSIYAWIAEAIRSLLPQLVQMGLATDDLMPIDSLELRLEAAAVATCCQVQGPGQICAWVRL